jgi:hypothetical protein
MNKRDESVRVEMPAVTAAKAEETVMAAEQTATGAEKKSAKAVEKSGTKERGKVVYCGPTVRGVAKQYTVYAGGMPQELEEFIQKHPAAAALVVPVDRFAQTRKRMENAGTAEAILYRKIKSEL